MSELSISERIAEGDRIREEIHGPSGGVPHVPHFATEFQTFSAEFCWSGIWGREALDRRSRSILTLGVLIAFRADDALRRHFRSAYINGVTLEEVEEIIYHAIAYAGFPQALLARVAAEDALAPEIAERAKGFAVQLEE